MDSEYTSALKIQLINVFKERKLPSKNEMKE